MYHQALYVAEDAAGILSGVKNYAGFKQIYSLMAKLYIEIGQPEKSNEMEEMSESFGQKAKEFRQ